MMIEEAIALFEAGRKYSKSGTIKINLNEDGYDVVLSALREKLETPRDWTPCAEGLPEFTNFYNVTVGVGGMLGYYKATRTYQYLKIKGEEPRWVIPDRFDEVVHVLAWKNLPAPWTGGLDGN
jgi:hypothetical protein